MKTTKREGVHVFYMTQSYQCDTKCHYCLRHTTLLSRMKVAGLKKDIHLTGKAGSIEISIVSILIVVFDLLIYSTFGIIKCSNLAFRFISLLTSLMIVLWKLIKLFDQTTFISRDTTDMRKLFQTGLEIV